MNKRKSDKNPQLFLELAQPDEKGESRWVELKEFIGKYESLYFDNGCTYGRSLEKKYNLEKRFEGRKIVALRLAGYTTQPSFNQSIRQDIKTAISKETCVMLGTSSGNSPNMKIEVDHKDGRKNDPRVSDVSTQKIEDFQPLCKAANDFKRQKCKECKSINKRWSAANLKGFEDFPFYAGGEDYKGTCVGCYLYDPVEYRRAFRKWIIEQNQ